MPMNRVFSCKAGGHGLQLLLAMICGFAGWITSQPVHAQPKVTLEDSIEMVKLGLPHERYYDSGAVIPSPDRKRFAVVTHRGNIRTGENEFALILFSSKDGTFTDTTRETLLQFNTSTGEPGISDVLWKDASTILFLGIRGAQSAQVMNMISPVANSIRSRRIPRR